MTLFVIDINGLSKKYSYSKPITLQMLTGHVFPIESEKTHNHPGYNGYMNDCPKCCERGEGLTIAWKHYTDLIDDYQELEDKLSKAIEALKMIVKISPWGNFKSESAKIARACLAEIQEDKQEEKCDCCGWDDNRMVCEPGCESQQKPQECEQDTPCDEHGHPELSTPFTSDGNPKPTERTVMERFDEKFKYVVYVGGALTGTNEVKSFWKEEITKLLRGLKMSKFNGNPETQQDFKNGYEFAKNVLENKIDTLLESL